MASNEESEEARQERLSRKEGDRLRRQSETPEERDARYHIRTPELN